MIKVLAKVSILCSSLTLPLHSFHICKNRFSQFHHWTMAAFTLTSAFNQYSQTLLLLTFFKDHISSFVINFISSRPSFHPLFASLLRLFQEFATSPERHGDLSRWGTDQSAFYCSVSCHFRIIFTSICYPWVHRTVNEFTLAFIYSSSGLGCR